MDGNEVVWEQAHILEQPFVLPLHDGGTALGRVVATITKRGGLSRDWYDLSIGVHLHTSDFGELVRPAVIKDGQGRSATGPSTFPISHDTLRGAKLEAIRFINVWADHHKAKVIGPG